MAEISLERILADLRGRAGFDGCSINRAYADWSNRGLLLFRREINRLGIEPVQVYGFAAGNKKNAADFHIVADAVETIHLHPTIRNYVLITGDSGFAVLAKKLRTYGRRVIGCAYGDAKSEVFASACEVFLTLPPPESGTRPTPDKDISDFRGPPSTPWELPSRG